MPSLTSSANSVLHETQLPSRSLIIAQWGSPPVITTVPQPVQLKENSPILALMYASASSRVDLWRAARLASLVGSVAAASAAVTCLSNSERLELICLEF